VTATGPTWVADEIEDAIAAALRDGNMRAAVSLIRMLAVIAPDDAQLILDVITANRPTGGEG
jgi:Flp pilus assembly protein TadD